MVGRAAYVLVGGKSSRFGQDKARYEVGGEPMALGVARVAEKVAGSVTLVGRPEDYSDLKVRLIADAEPAAGPLSGLVAALEDTAARWTLVVACDMPSLRADFLEMLFRTAETSGASAVVPVQPDGRIQPLCAVYSRELYGPLAHNLRHGVSKLTKALGGLNIRYLNEPEYARLDPSGDLMRNVNTPGDLAQP